MAPKPEQAADLEVAVVARGRTVIHGGKSHAPGSRVSLLSHEVEWLRAAGFLLKPEAEDAQAVTGQPAVIRPT